MLRVGCRYCGSADFTSRRVPFSVPPVVNHRCNSCGRSWSATYRSRDVVVAVMLGVALIAAVGVAIRFLFFA